MNFLKKMFNPLLLGLAEGIKPKPRLTLSEWSEKNLYIPPERAAAPGPYRVGDATFQRGMMDAVTDPDNEEVVYVTSSQVGKTTIIAAVQGYYSEAEPSGQLSAWPTQDVANAYVAETYLPTVRDSKAWSRVITSRTQTEFKGGFIKFVGANTPNKLAMTPIRVVTGDELDRWPSSSAKEGSPVELAKRRQTTFHNRKSLWVSTPVHEETSQIVRLFRETKQHYFLVTCPNPQCALKQVLKWENVHYAKGKESDAEYACEGCGDCWNEMTKRRLVRAGEWHAVGATIGKTPTGAPIALAAPFKCFAEGAQPKRGKVGFWLNELYSPWSSMRSMAEGWTESEGNIEMEQTFYNTRLGMPFSGDISSFADPEGLRGRREKYDPTKVPKRAALVTAAADVQDDRIEVLVTAWGAGEECWLLDHHVINVDPSTDAAWEELAQIFERRYPHLGAANKTLPIYAATVDSGGHFTQRAYAFSGKWLATGRRWYAHKGVPGEKKPIWIKSEQRFKDSVKLFLIGVDDAKTTIYTRYGIIKKGPGYIHLHEGITDDQVNQMTAERAETEYVNGFAKRKWTKPKHRRNEMLDLIAYNHAVRCSVTIDLPSWIQHLNTPPEAQEKPRDAGEIGALFK